MKNKEDIESRRHCRKDAKESTAVAWSYGQEG